MARIHISVSLTGGAALGAYQAGAMAALLTAVDRLRADDRHSVAIDAMGGASAGSLVALLSATAHLCGLDPVHLLRAAWVEEVSSDLFLEGSERAPLGSTGLRSRMRELLVGWDADRETTADAPMALHLSLAGLRGLSYRVDGLRGPGTIPAVTYDDWDTFRLDPGFDRPGLFAPEGRCPADAAFASAANPGVFPPKLLDRSAVRPVYERHGIVDLPDHGRLWFSDGGLAGTEPIGRIVEASRELHGPPDHGRHLVLLVDPRSEDPSTAERWADPDRSPEWLGALARALETIPAKGLYDDVRRVQRDNRRRALAHDVAEALVGHLDDSTSQDLRAVLERHGVSTEWPDGLRSQLGLAFDAVGGIDGHSRLDVDVLSPFSIVEEEGSVERVLAGDLLGDFGGFLDRRLRESDFVLGYATTLRWLPDGLTALGVDEPAVAAAVEAVEAAHVHDWAAVNRGGTTFGDLPAEARIALARVVARGIAAAVGETMRAVDLPERAVSALGHLRHQTLDLAARIRRLRGK